MGNSEIEANFTNLNQDQRVWRNSCEKTLTGFTGYWITYDESGALNHMLLLNSQGKSITCDVQDEEILMEYLPPAELIVSESQVIDPRSVMLTSVIHQPPQREEQIGQEIEYPLMYSENLTPEDLRLLGILGLSILDEEKELIYHYGIDDIETVILNPTNRTLVLFPSARYMDKTSDDKVQRFPLAQTSVFPMTAEDFELK